MALTSSSGSNAPPAPSPAAAAASPADPAAYGLAAIFLLHCSNSGVPAVSRSFLPHRGVDPNLRWVPLADLCHALSPDLCCDHLPNFFVRSRPTSVLSSCATSSVVSIVLSRTACVVCSCATSGVLSAVCSCLTSRSTSVFLLRPIFAVFLFVRSLLSSFFRSLSSSLF